MVFFVTKRDPKKTEKKHYIMTASSVSRGAERTISLRDGDCLRVDTGPFGPPPPTPARSACRGICFSSGLWIAGIGLWTRAPGRWIMLLLLIHSQAVQTLPPAPDGIPVPRYSIGHFPWRAPLERQDLRHVCRDRICRVSLLCPWRGPQGIFQTGRHTGLDRVWEHYFERGRPRELVPVWPCLTADRIWVVPRIHLAGAIKCVVVQLAGQFRALALPVELSPARLLEVARYLTGWDIGHLRVPPGLQARVGLHEDVYHLRDGDLLDGLAPGDDGGRYIIRSPSEIKDHVLWSRAMVIQRPTHVRLWSPAIRPPILACVPLESRWDPHKLTFPGEFSENFPGRWAPAPWTPCRVPQLVLASGDLDTANVLFEDSSGVRCLNLERFASPSELAEGTADNGRGIRVLGMLSLGTQAPLCLRDGDVVVTGPLLRAEDSAWPDLQNGVGSRRTSGSLGLWICCLAFPRGLRTVCLTAFFVTSGGAVVADSRLASPSRSRSPVEPRTRSCPSPRIGGWQPERRHPMHQVLTRSEHHFQVLCPFRGWGEVHDFSRRDQFAHFLRAVHGDAGTWASDFLPLGGESLGHFTVFLPIPPPPLAVILVHSAETSRSVLVPSYTTLRQVSDYLVDLIAVPGLRVIVPPSLRRVEGYLDDVVRLRHGDTFEVQLGPSHPRVRRREAIFVSELSSLPHLNVWHVSMHYGGTRRLGLRVGHVRGREQPLQPVLD